MAHNSFTVKPIEIDGVTSYECKSHNYQGIVGNGISEKEAIDDMINKLEQLRINDPKAFKESIKKRLKMGLECMCGVKMEGNYIGSV